MADRKTVTVYVALVRDKDGSWKPYAYTNWAAMVSMLAQYMQVVTFEVTE